MKEQEAAARVALKLSKAVAEYNDKVEARYVARFQTLDIVVDESEKKPERTQINLDVLLLIDPLPVSLVSHMARLPSDYAYWGMVKATLEDELAQARVEYDTWHAEKYDAVCTSKDLPRTATETYKESQVILQFNNEHCERKAKLNKLESSVRKVKVLLTALEYKQEMLRSIGAMVRQEMEQALMVDGAVMTSKETGGSLKRIKRL